MTLWGGGISWHSQTQTTLPRPPLPTLLAQLATNTLLHLGQQEQPTPAEPASEGASGVPWQGL